MFEIDILFCEEKRKSMATLFANLCGTGDTLKLLLVGTSATVCKYSKSSKAQPSRQTNQEKNYFYKFMKFRKKFFQHCSAIVLRTNGAAVPLVERIGK
jgi:shikimate kinase